MKKYLYMLRADLVFSEPVTEHTFVLRALPVSDVTQEITRASLTCQPNARLSNGTDSQGNNISLGHIAEKHSTFSFCSTGEVQLNPQFRSREGAYPYYRYPTALTRLSGGLEDYYLTNQILGTPTEKAYHWMDLLSRDLRYEKGVTTTETNAAACWEIGAVSVRILRMSCFRSYAPTGLSADMWPAFSRVKERHMRGLNISTESAGFRLTRHTTESAALNI